MVNCVELLAQFPAASRWFDSLAVHPAFITGAQKVGLSVSPTNSCNNSCETVTSNAVTNASESFFKVKWKLRRDRQKPL